MHGYYRIYQKKVIKHFFSVNDIVLFANISSFFPKLLLKSFIFYGSDFSHIDIVKISIVSSYASQYSSKFHPFFNTLKKIVETETKLDFISSIWDYDHIMRLDENN